MDEDIKTKSDVIGKVTLPLKNYEDQQEKFVETNWSSLRS